MPQCPKTVAGLAALVVLFAGFSCSVPDQNSDSSNNANSNADSPAGYGDIPNSARRVSDGYGSLRYRAERDGTVWIGNESRRFVVVSKRVNSGDLIEVNPGDNRIEIEGRTVYDRDMEAGARHAIFLNGGGSWDDWGGRDPYAEIPRRARNVSSGTGRIEWRADEAGRVWIGNDKRQAVVIADEVRRGDLVEVIPNQNQVKINGRIVYNQNMESKHPHSIFFANPDSMGGR